jgi:hypothetical protein
MAIIAAGEKIYPNETFWYTIPRAVIYDGTSRTLLTNLNAPSSFTAQIEVVDGASGNEAPVDMTHHPTQRGAWQVQLQAPDTAGLYRVHAIALKSGGRGDWQDEFTVE